LDVGAWYAFDSLARAVARQTLTGVDVSVLSLEQSKRSRRDVARSEVELAIDTIGWLGAVDVAHGPRDRIVGVRIAGEAGRAFER
jgi:hypothetical protein